MKIYIVSVHDYDPEEAYIAESLEDVINMAGLGEFDVENATKGHYTVLRKRKRDRFVGYIEEREIAPGRIL